MTIGASFPASPGGAPSCEDEPHPLAMSAAATGAAAITSKSEGCRIALLAYATDARPSCCTAVVLDLEFVRDQFPALASGFVYLDNAGGSQTLGRVADRIRDYLLTSNVQLGASYAISEVSSARVDEAARETARYVGAAEGEIVLGASTTQLLQNLSRAMEAELSPGDEIVTTEADHEANVGPWTRLASRGVVIKVWPLDPDTLRLEERGLVPLLTKRTRLVAFPHVSNVLIA